MNVKPLPGLFGVSVLVNVGFLAAFIIKPTLAPREFWRFVPLGTSFSQSAGWSTVGTHVSETTLSLKGSDAGQTTADSPSLWSQLDSKDPATLVARLRAAGFPPTSVRAMLNARLTEENKVRLEERLPKPGFWKSWAENNDNYRVVETAQREKERSLRQLMGSDYYSASLDPADLKYQHDVFGDLGAGQIGQVERIKDDYLDMISQAQTATKGIMLQEDRDKMALLRKEKHADLAAVLPPSQLEAFEMRDSTLTTAKRAAFTLMNATDDEFRKVCTILQSYQDASPFEGGPALRQTREKMAVEIKTALGDQRYADYQRVSEPSYRDKYQAALDAGLEGDAAQRKVNGTK